MATLPWIPPMLATRVNAPFSRPGWLFESKWDGERCLAYKQSGNLRLFTRNRKPLNTTYPEIAEALEKQKNGPFILDGEIVAFEPGSGLASFHRLQERMHALNPSESLRRRVPVVYYLFDILCLERRDLRSQPLIERKAILHRHLRWTDPLRFSTHLEDEGILYYRQACRMGWEGLIAKRSASRYQSGRSRDWMKLKCLNEQEFVIGGFTDPQSSHNAFGALLLGYYEGEKLKFAGKVGTGFDDRALTLLGQKMASLERDVSPFVSVDLPRRGLRWVEPKLVAEIAFGEWTPDGKLRHPRYIGLRGDIPPHRVVRETVKNSSLIRVAN